MDPQKLQKVKDLLQQAMTLLDAASGAGAPDETATDPTGADDQSGAPVDNMAGKSIGMRMAKYRMGQ